MEILQIKTLKVSYEVVSSGLLIDDIIDSDIIFSDYTTAFY